MGGDGGTVSTNRTYLRGAGKACHTADHPSNALKRAKLEDAERARLVLSTCAVSGTALDFSPAKKNHGGGIGGGASGGTVSSADIVTCPYGKLYKRENVLEALLRRSQTGGGDDNLGSHIRMKDLHPVRFHVTNSSLPPSSSQQGGGAANGNGSVCQKYMAACPITGSEISSGNVPCFVIVRRKTKSKDEKGSEEEQDEVEHNPNVLSERAIKEMGVPGLQAEYGPFEEKDMIRLAPPLTGGVFEEIQRKWEARMEEDRVAKQLKKKMDKKRRRFETEKPEKALPSSILGISNNSNVGKMVTSKKSAADEARSTVQSAVAHNPVLSDLFGTGKKRQQSEKEKRDALFTRNC